MVLPMIDDTIAYDLVVQSEHEKRLGIVSCEFRQKVGWIGIIEACLFKERNLFYVVLPDCSDVLLRDCQQPILIPLKILLRPPEQQLRFPSPLLGCMVPVWDQSRLR